MMSEPDAHLHTSTDATRVTLPEGDSWSLDLEDPARRQLVASALSGLTSVVCLTLAATRGQLASLNDLLTVLFGVALGVLALAALARWRFVRANRPLRITIDPERVSTPHLGWRVGLASIPWSELTGVGVRQAGGKPHSVALVTSSRTYLLPRDLVPSGLSPVQLAGIIEHFRRLHGSR